MTTTPNDKTASKDTLWTASVRMTRFPTLTENMRSDVCVVGAGIAGLTTAYLLAEAGLRVVVVDARQIGMGETARTTAHLVSALDRRYFDLVRHHGEAGIRQIAESHTAALACIESIVQREKIHCEFQRVDGYLVGAAGDGEKILDKEVKAAALAGLTGVERLLRCPVSAFGAEACLRFPRQAQFHPLQYLKGLARAIQAAGGQIFCNTLVKDVRGGADARVETESGAVVHAKHLVVATNSPINDRVVMHTKQAPYRTYVVGLAIPPGQAFRGLVWDTEDPFHYVRTHTPSSQDSGAPGTFLIVGGEDHKTGQADVPEQERFGRLEDWARTRFPEAQHVAFQWSGQIMETIDGIAFIGRNPSDEDNVYIATGDCGVGMTHGTIAGMLLTDLIQGKDNPWTELYDPSRKRISGAWEFAKENLNVAFRYFDWLTGSNVSDANSIGKGEGAVVRRGLGKIALYRDEHGALHEMSAACPHLGCVVSWNGAEKSWDCPCHGSRFGPKGDVLNGPAISNLEPLNDHDGKQS